MLVKIEIKIQRWFPLLSSLLLSHLLFSFSLSFQLSSFLFSSLLLFPIFSSLLYSFLSLFSSFLFSSVTLTSQWKQISTLSPSPPLLLYLRLACSLSKLQKKIKYNLRKKRKYQKEIIPKYNSILKKSWKVK